MPKVRVVDEMNETELRAELVSLFADGRCPLKRATSVTRTVPAFFGSVEM